MFGHSFSVVLFWAIGTAVLTILGIVYALGARSKTKGPATKSPLNRSTAKSNPVLGITIEPDSGEHAEEVWDIPPGTPASTLLESIPEGLLGVLEKLKGKAILWIPADVMRLLDNGQAGLLIARDHPIQVVLLEKTKDAVICTPQAWTLPYCVDRVGSAWKMLSFLVGQMDTTRMRSTLANIHSILRELRQYERDKSLGALKGNLQYLSECKPHPAQEHLNGSSPSTAEFESIYREGLQSSSTYAIALKSCGTNLAAAQLSSFFCKQGGGGDADEVHQRLSSRCIHPFVRNLRDCYFGCDVRERYSRMCDVS